MEAIASSGCPRLANLASASISLALVFGGGAAYAEGITPLAAAPLATMVGNFSQSDLAELERSSATVETKVQVSTSALAERVLNRQKPTISRGVGAAPVEADLFPHTGRLLPLLVVRPEAASVVAVQGPSPGRPGAAQPVGVSPSRVRSFVQRERTGL